MRLFHAVAEEMAASGSFTLFTTHFHHLCALQDTYPTIQHSTIDQG